MTMLRVRDMTVRFGGIVALDGISLDLNRGEILGLIGPNGAGKTTLFNCISGVIHPDRGSIFFEGHSLVYAPPHVRARFGIARTFQNLQLWGSMTVEENLVVPMDALGRRNTFSDALYLPFSTYAERASRERARAILHVLELDRHARTLAADLPAGIQRRVEIARALAMRPRLLLLDEPAAGLDAQETARLAELLHAVRQRFHVSMLLVDHDMSLVLRVCDYVYVLDFGKLLARGQPSAIRSDPKVIAAYLGEESKQSTGETTTVVAAPKQAAPLLEVKQVAAGYGGLEVIRDVSLQVRPGEVVACIGANGAGKTTTLRAISGMIHPRRGRVMFAGIEVTGRTAERISKLGLIHIPEGRGLFPRLTVEDTLRLVSNTAGHEVDITPAFQLFPKLRERRRQLVGTLSGGEQQMVAMARAILSRPRLVMIDEMSQGLAPSVVRQLFEIIRVFRDEGIAVLLVEQFVESALDVADRAYVFEHGSIVLSGAAVDLRSDRKLVAGSYLGTAVETPAMAAADGNGHRVDPALMEIVSVRVPAKVKRALEQRAEAEGRPTGAVAIELLEKVDRQ
ncbi:MAG: ATP-binding cassette domain-containing protein [Chloroflexi bacterium]|nr:MAG: ATP-binding cassette domain-containing protein [Chloroflexota bacterium]TMG66777.1 MAG: ATP-binding cassette domain-containing protein [Chloroflexota bacterium]